MVKVEKKWRVAVVGATGMVGQRFVTLLAGHPWFELTCLAASARSAGKSYAEAVGSRWAMPGEIPAGVREMPVLDAAKREEIAGQVDFLFCAVDMDKAAIREMEDAFAKLEIPVISNNSAHRNTPDVPMVIPELNSEQFAIIQAQRARLGTKTGFVAVKPNCSIQSYVPALHPLLHLGPKQVVVSTYQAISGAGKTFATWPEMLDNVIPYIGGEEEKSEQEPLRIWGRVENGRVIPAAEPVIAAQCIRVPVSDGHLATVSVSFDKKATKEEILEAWNGFETLPQQLGLPSAPKPFLRYFIEDDRPQTRIDRDEGHGMSVTIGRLREDRIFDWRFVCLSHNTLRGAAGGAVLTAEMLCAQDYIPRMG